MKNVKILSLIFALVVMFSLCAVSVLAAEAPAAEAETTAAPAADEAAETEEHSGFEPMNFIYNLKYMGIGMLCIIIVIGVLIGVTMVLNKVTVKKN